MINKWPDLISVLKQNTTSRRVDVGIAAKYKGDLNSLLTREFGIAEEHLIPNVLVNGLTSSTEYDGVETEIILVSTDVLSKYK